MELQEYVTILRRRWLTVTAVTVLALAAGTAYLLTTSPTYRSTSSVFFAIRNGSTPQELAQGLTFTESLVASYTRVATTPAVLNPVIEQLGLRDSPAQLAKRVSAEAPVNTVILDITVSGSSGAESARIANAVAAQLAVVAANLSPGSTANAETLRVTTIAQAAEPVLPFSPRRRLVMGLALVLGLGGGFAVALLRSLLDNRVREADAVRLTGQPVLATFNLERGGGSRIPVRDAPYGARAESFRQLRTNLQFINLDRPPRVMVVASAMSGEGKSETAINLALTLADAGRHVLLVDGDLRSPSVADYLGLEGAAGLTTVLTGAASLADVVQPWGATQLEVLAAGSVPPNPSELLGSQRMADLLSEARAKYDIVLFDSAPIIPVTDGAVLARMTDGVLLVAGYDKIRQPQLTAAVAALGNVGAQVLGVVLNRLPARKGTAGYGYGVPPSGNPQVTNLGVTAPQGLDRTKSQAVGAAASMSRTTRNESTSSRRAWHRLGGSLR